MKYSFPRRFGEWLLQSGSTICPPRPKFSHLDCYPEQGLNLMQCWKAAVFWWPPSNIQSAAQYYAEFELTHGPAGGAKGSFEEIEQSG